MLSQRYAETARIAALLLFDLNDLLTPIRATVHAHVMGPLRRTAPLANDELMWFELPLTAALAASSLRDPELRDSTHGLYTLLFGFLGQ
jgi:hypothetical protein